MVLDNASNNDTLIERLEFIVPYFKGRESRVRCFNHVVNLVAKSILRLFSKKKADNDDDDLDDIFDGYDNNLITNESIIEDDEDFFIPRDKPDDDLADGAYIAPIDITGLSEEALPIGVALEKVC
jgi:hypothetical protein